MYKQRMKLSAVCRWFCLGCSHGGTWSAPDLGLSAQLVSCAAMPIAVLHFDIPSVSLCLFQPPQGFEPVPFCVAHNDQGTTFVPHAAIMSF
jgi:hypothetical protein